MPSCFSVDIIRISSVRGAFSSANPSDAGSVVAFRLFISTSKLDWYFFSDFLTCSKKRYECVRACVHELQRYTSTFDYKETEKQTPSALIFDYGFPRIRTHIINRGEAIERCDQQDFDFIYPKFVRVQFKRSLLLANPANWQVIRIDYKLRFFFHIYRYNFEISIGNKCSERFSQLNTVWTGLCSPLCFCWCFEIVSVVAVTQFICWTFTYLDYTYFVLRKKFSEAINASTQM